MKNALIDGNHRLFYCDENLLKAIQEYYANLWNIQSTLKVLQTVGPWADYFVSELAPVVQGPLVYFSTNWDVSLESLNVVAEHVEEKIQVLGSFGSWAEELIRCLRRIQTFVEDRIKVVLKVLGSPVFPQEILVRETEFFEYHGFGRPPRILGRALKASLSLKTGRMRSSLALA